MSSVASAQLLLFRLHPFSLPWRAWSSTSGRALSQHLCGNRCGNVRFEGVERAPGSKRKTSGLRSSRTPCVTYAARLRRRHGRLTSSNCYFSSLSTLLVAPLASWFLSRPQVQGLCRQFAAAAVGGPPQTIIAAFSGNRLDRADSQLHKGLFIGSKAAWLRISSHFYASCLTKSCRIQCSISSQSCRSRSPCIRS